MLLPIQREVLPYPFCLKAARRRWNKRIYIEPSKSTNRVSSLINFHSQLY